MVYQIDNGQDLRSYVTSFASKVGPEHPEIKYERHHVSSPLITPIEMCELAFKGSLHKDIKPISANLQSRVLRKPSAPTTDKSAISTLQADPR